MLVSDSEIKERFESPLNLLNRLKSGLASSGRANIVSMPPTADKVIEDLEDKLKYGSLKSKASAIMNLALDELQIRVSEVQKPKELAAIASEMNKVLVAQEEKKDRHEMPQIVVYSPTFLTEDAFESIVVKE